MNFDRVSEELNNYIKSKSFMAFALPIANILIYVCIGIRVLNLFIGMGSIILTIVTYVYFFSIVLLVAKKDYLSLAIGLGGNGAIYVFRMIRSLFSRYLSVSLLIDIAVYLLLAYVAFKKSQTLDSVQDGQKVNKGDKAKKGDTSRE
jgi:hypothetical protein